MKKILKRFVTLLVCMVLIIGLLPIYNQTVKAEIYSGKCGDDVYWKLDTEMGVLTIYGNGKMDDYVYSTKKPFTKSEKEMVTKIEISSGVKNIGGQVFAWFDNLTSVIIPDSVTSIDEQAFYHCKKLTNIIIPNSVTHIEEEAFIGCEEITNITIPESVGSIGRYGFANCSNLKSLTIPKSLTYIGEYAFYNCEKLEEVHINNIESWLKIKFNNCYSNPLFYADHLFINEELVKNIVIPDNIEKLENYVFEGCSGLTIMIPNSVTSIGNDTFDGCDAIIQNSNGNIMLSQVKYNTNGGLNGPSSQIMFQGELLNLSTKTPIRSGYIFGGWSRIICGDVEYNPGDAYIKKEDVILYAVWLLDCKKCSGKGYESETQVCNQCEGSGRVNMKFESCIWCDGTGRSVTYPDILVKCPDCKGLGNLHIPGFYLNCSTCEGKGKVDGKTCSTCWGSGKGKFVPPVNWSCKTCQGTGTVYIRGDKQVEICSSCNGKGGRWSSDECYKCNGKGNVLVLTANKCQECNGKGKVQSEDNHNYSSWENVKTATCTSNGQMTRICSRCGKTETQIVEPEEHKYINTLIEPTCTKKGYTIHKCSVCGESYTDNYQDMTGHSFGEWLITKPVGCIENGEKIRTCSICGETETQIIEMLGHNYVDSIIKPSCTETGYTIHECSYCGIKWESDYKEAQHSYSEWIITKPATATKEGEQIRECSICGKKETKVIAKLENNTDIESSTISVIEKSTILVEITTEKQNNNNTSTGTSTEKTTNAKGTISSVSTKPAKVKFSLKAGKKKVSLKWSKVKGVSGYTIYYKTSKKGKWKKLKIFSAKKTKYVKKKLKSGKKYYFTVKAYKKVNGKKVYGKFVTKKIIVK